MITNIRADNPGPMTLTGTNTWLIPAAEGGLVVVDPGPRLDDHQAGILAAGPIRSILLTHHHRDHSELAPALSELTGAPVRAADPRLCRGGDPLTDGELLPDGLQVVTTPGHTSDSVCLLHRDQRVILTGDTVLGQGSSVITYGDGSVSDSLTSLERLASLAVEWEVSRLLPGHGREVGDPLPRLQHDIAHRRDRIAQVERALADGAHGVVEVTAQVHAGLDPRLQAAAQTSIAAHLDYLDSLSADDPWLTGREQA